VAGVSDIQAMLDDVYGVAGVAASWTPAGQAQVLCTALVLGGDEAGRFRELVGQPNMSSRTIKLRVAEIGVDPAPLGGDLVSLGSDTCTLLADQAPFVITGDPRREDPRRLEWTIELADALPIIVAPFSSGGQLDFSDPDNSALDPTIL
jgi:hypothetical protein